MPMNLSKLLFGDRSNQHSHHGGHRYQRLLPHHSSDDIPSGIDPKRVTQVAMRLKYLVEETIPCELKEEDIIRPHSPILTTTVIDLARNAGGHEDRACVAYCLLVCMRWFKQQALKELYDADLDLLRATACQIIAKRIIEDTEDQEYLFQELLVKRYQHLQNGETTMSSSVIERSVDLHATQIIGSSGYQKCIKYLWKGWLHQDDKDATQFSFYNHLADEGYWIHFNPDRMRAPIYQNTFQILMSFVFLTFYTIAINTVNPDGDVDVIEAILYIFTLGFVMDEFAKFWKVGRWYLGFWNIFNSTLYALLITSFVTRMIALSKPSESDERKRFNVLSYNFLAFTAPMFWSRILLYLDSFRAFGAMLVILKQMFAESFIFFALLAVVMIGTLQAFIGMDSTDAETTRPVTGFIMRSMLNAVLQSPDFEGFDKFSYPFGTILYYLFTFVVMVLLLNILIALFNSAYEDITDNAIDEYMALFAAKTMQFVRAPDENVFMPPFNLVEVFLLVLPFEWWMPKIMYAKLNDRVMAIVYAPFMLIMAWIDQSNATKIRKNRSVDQPDDDEQEDWEELDSRPDFAATGWLQRVKDAVPNVEEDFAVQEIKILRKELSALLEALEKAGTIKLDKEFTKLDNQDEERQVNGEEGSGKQKAPNEGEGGGEPLPDLDAPEETAAGKGDTKADDEAPDNE